MKNFSFSRFLIFLLVVAIALLAPSCNHSITSTRKAEDATNIIFQPPSPYESLAYGTERWATARIAEDFDGIWLTVQEKGRKYFTALCYVQHTTIDNPQIWEDENEGTWYGYTTFENGHTITRFWHKFKDESEKQLHYINSIITDDYLVCAGGDTATIMYGEGKNKVPTTFTVEWCRWDICRLTTVIKGKPVVYYLAETLIAQERIPETYRRGK